MPGEYRPTSEPIVSPLTCSQCGSAEFPWHAVEWLTVVVGDRIELRSRINAVGICATCGAPFDGPKLHTDIEARIRASQHTAERVLAGEQRAHAREARR